MAWTPRVQANIPTTGPSITVYDGLQVYGSLYGANITKCAQGEMGVVLYGFPFTGAPPTFIQGNAAVTGAAGISSFSISLAKKSDGANTLLLDVYWYDNSTSSGWAGLSITDSNGNGWTPYTMAQKNISAPVWSQQWFCFPTQPGGPLTITVSAVSPSTSFATMALAVTEYSNFPRNSIPPYGLNIYIWEPSQIYVFNQKILDNAQGGQHVSAVQANPPNTNYPNGESGTNAPGFSSTSGATTSDNQLTWTRGGPNFSLVSRTFTDFTPVNVTVFSAQGGYQAFLHLVVAALYGCPANAPTAPAGGSVPITLPQGWYIVNEPSLGFTDQSARLFRGQGAQHSGNLQSRQRGNWNYTLIVAATDAYEPTLFSPVFFYDQTPAGFTLVFVGIIQTYKHRQIATQGWRYIDCTAVSLEALLDTVMVTTPKQYVNQTCGFILTDLYNSFEAGAAFTLGTVQAGATIPLFNAQVGDKLSDLATQLATMSEFTWNISPQTQQLFFGAPTAMTAPFTIGSPQAMWDSITWSFDGSDYRNRQAVRLSFDAFAHSMEFFAGAGQQSFTLMRPVKQVVNAYITLSTCNSATAAFSGQPADGDTFTIGPASGVWQAGHVYALGGVIVVNGFVQKVTAAGTSGGSQPTFSTVTGQTTTDNTVIWTCQGPLGLGTNLQTYTFKTVIDNTQFGQVFIDTTVARTVQNAVDAINANAATRGVGFSLPTWENSQCNAITVTGTGFTLQQKAAGSGWVATLSKSSANFAWSATQTSGGTSPQGSVGPNQGATITIQVYAQGTSTAAPGLAYTEGSAVINLATPLNSGTNLNVEYTRADGDVIQCERTDLVASEAAITHGTGKLQQITDASSLGSIAVNPLSGLQLCQQALASYDVPPEEIEVEILKPGILPGQLVTLALTGALSALNGSYYAEEVRVQFVPLSGAGPTPWMDQSQAPGGGHYRYTLRLIDTAQIGSYLDWWLHSGGGGGSSTGLVATSGGAAPTSPRGQTVTVDGATVTNPNFSDATPSAGSGKVNVAWQTDGTNISAQISKGTSSVFGVVEVDGITITSIAGVISGVPVSTGGSVNLQSANYTAVAGDNGKLISFNAPGAVTLTLPSNPSSNYTVSVENTGVGAVIISNTSTSSPSPYPPPPTWTLASHIESGSDYAVNVFSVTQAIAAAINVSSNWAQNSEWGQTLIALKTTAGAPVLAQSASLVNTSSGLVQTMTFGSNTASGHAIVVCIFYGYASNLDFITVTDSQSNTYTRRDAASANQGNCQVFTAQNITGGTTPTITLTVTNLGSPNGWSAIALEYGGMTSTPFDSVSAASNTTSGTLGATVTPTSPGDLILWAVGVTHGNSASFSTNGIIDFLLTSISLNQNQGVVVFAGAPGYFTERGLATTGSLSPLTTKGDVWGFDTANDRVPIGSNTQVLTADSTQALGLKWAAASPLTTKGDVYTFGTGNARLPVGTAGQVLTVNASATDGIDWETPATTYTPLNQSLKVNGVEFSDDYFITVNQSAPITVNGSAANPPLMMLGAPGIAAGILSDGNKIKTYNVLPTAGLGLMVILAVADLTGKNAASTVVTYTPAGAGTFRVGGYVTITAVLTDVAQLQLLWTDETSTARTLVMLPVGGATLTTATFFCFPAVDIRVNAGTAITLQVALTTSIGSITYDCGGSIVQIV